MALVLCSGASPNPFGSKMAPKRLPAPQPPPTQLQGLSAPRCPIISESCFQVPFKPVCIHAFAPTHPPTRPCSLQEGLLEAYLNPAIVCFSQHLLSRRPGPWQGRRRASNPAPGCICLPGPEAAQSLVICQIFLSATSPSCQSVKIQLTPQG